MMRKKELTKEGKMLEDLLECEKVYLKNLEKGWEPSKEYFIMNSEKRIKQLEELIKKQRDKNE